MDQQISNNTRESEATLLEDIWVLFFFFKLTAFEAELHCEISPKSKMSHFTLYVQMCHSHWFH